MPRQKYMRTRAQGLDADTLALQVSNPADVLVSEQLKAARVDPGQHRDRAACIHRHHKRRGEIQSKVHLAARDRVRLPRGCLSHDIVDLGEALCVQQLLGDILRRDANALDLCKADAGRFRRRLGGER